MINLNERSSNDWEQADNRARQREVNLRVACPGIIQSFDAEEQTVSVQLALRERRYDQGDESWVEVPQLVDVPIVLPRAGGYALTFPVKEGDECLVVFGDCCMDAWWQSGGVQNQIDCRRHDLSDGFAVLGIWSQPRILPNYNESAAQLRTESGSSYISIAGDDIEIRAAGTVRITGAEVRINE